MPETSSVEPLQLLKKEVARILHTESVDETRPLAELGIDSVNIVELMLFCEQLYGMIDPESLAIDQFTTLAMLNEKLLCRSEVTA